MVSVVLLYYGGAVLDLSGEFSGKFFEGDLMRQAIRPAHLVTLVSMLLDKMIDDFVESEACKRRGVIRVSIIPGAYIIFIIIIARIFCLFYSSFQQPQLWAIY